LSRKPDGCQNSYQDKHQVLSEVEHAYQNASN